MLGPAVLRHRLVVKRSNTSGDSSCLIRAPASRHSRAALTRPCSRPCQSLTLEAAGESLGRTALHSLSWPPVQNVCV
ncbi:hypothetical protein E2C01_030007 [Portunus trituberculatus]|uniref:Uncharacterized protein n=1 Tax=Portunus trituberculatus TaxID=210409 RepID=A0A5B7ET25_PORTR|nr:hypothetical protein [Portunus trituberculatus]